MEYLRTGAVSDGFLFGRDANAWAEGAIPVELFSCGRCRALRFCAEEEWVARRQEEEREKQREPGDMRSGWNSSGRNGSR